MIFSKVLEEKMFSYCGGLFVELAKPNNEKLGKVESNMCIGNFYFCVD